MDHLIPLVRSAPTQQVVARPSAVDGIGHALRSTFARDTDMPAAWQDCMCQLDRIHPG